MLAVKKLLVKRLLEALLEAGTPLEVESLERPQAEGLEEGLKAPAEAAETSADRAWSWAPQHTPLQAQQASPEVPRGRLYIVSLEPLLAL